MIYNYDKLTVLNANADVVIGSGSNDYINWNGEQSTFTTNYFNYNSGSYLTQTNVCQPGQFIYSYPQQTASCATLAYSFPWYYILAIVFCGFFALAVCFVLVVALIMVVILLIKKATNAKLFSKSKHFGNQRRGGRVADEKQMPLVSVLTHSIIILKLFRKKKYTLF